MDTGQIVFAKLSLQRKIEDVLLTFEYAEMVAKADGRSLSLRVSSRSAMEAKETLQECLSFVWGVLPQFLL